MLKSKCGKIDDFHAEEKLVDTTKKSKCEDLTSGTP
jgi:hypothetical protein